MSLCQCVVMHLLLHKPLHPYHRCGAKFLLQAMLVTLVNHIHLVAKKQKSRLQIMREILKKDVVDYVYCLYGMDYLEVEDAIYQLTSIAEDYQADVVFSTYKVLEVEKGLFYQYRTDNQIHVVKASDYEVYQKKHFSNLNSLQGTLIKTPIIESVLNETVATEDEVMLKVISRSSRIYYKDSYFWIKKS